MKVTAITSLLFLVCVAAQSATATGDAVMKAEQDWMNAMKRRDRATLERIMAPEFTLSGVSDLERPPLPREVWLANTMSALHVESFTFGTKRVSLFGNTAIVQADFTWSGDFGGEKFTDRVIVIDTWMKREGQWIVVSRIIGDAPAAKA